MHKPVNKLAIMTQWTTNTNNAIAQKMDSCLTQWLFLAGFAHLPVADVVHRGLVVLADVGVGCHSQDASVVARSTHRVMMFAFEPRRACMCVCVCCQVGWGWGATVRDEVTSEAIV